MATFLTSVFIIAILALVTTRYVETNKNEFGYTYLGAFVLWSIIIAVAQAISFVISAFAMMLFDFKPDSIGDLILWLIWFYFMLVLVFGCVKKDTK
ncbi:hypothetical protein J9V81_004437 [Salmonella enterica]|nr:hypothetical protein [Salmonella enterica]